MKLKAQYYQNKAFNIQIRGHEYICDQDKEDGGDDKGMMPSEMFISSLVVCIGVYLQGFLARKDIDIDGLLVEADWEKSKKGDGPNRINSITMRVTLPKGVPEKYEQALYRVANSCMIHNTLENFNTLKWELNINLPED